MDKRDKLHMLVHNFIRDYKIESEDKLWDLALKDSDYHRGLDNLMQELVETVGYWDRGE